MRRRSFIAALGGAAVWPMMARGQQPAMPVIGLLSSRSAGDSVSAVAAFRAGLAETGYVEGRNVVIEFRWAEGQFDRLPALAEELVRRPVAVLAPVAGYQTPRAAQAATSTIPIVFGIGEDPVREGLVANLESTGRKYNGRYLFYRASRGQAARRIAAARPTGRTDRPSGQPEQHARARAGARRARGCAEAWTTACCFERW